MAPWAGQGLAIIIRRPPETALLDGSFFMLERLDFSCCERFFFVFSYELVVSVFCSVVT